MTLSDSTAFSGFAVPDTAAAQQFYGETLGLKVTEEYGLLTLHLNGGDRPTLIYPKPDHTPASYTILNFKVDDIEAAVDALAARGVEFARYDGMEQDERGIMRGGGPYIAWFTDPAGNILSVLQDRP
jgi:catechol 2,3-dioxygenase-like lactoylglutathione lyase family enzyme